MFLSIVPLPASKLLQAQELLEPILASRKELEGKYLALITLAQRAQGFLISLQHCLANKDMLKDRRSLNPMPPDFLLLQREL